MPNPPPPRTRRGDTVDVLHGEQLPDPYRWLEDTASEETRAWVRAQNRYTQDVLSASTVRNELRARLEATWDFPRLGAPYERGGRWFQLRNSGLQPQSVLYVMNAPDDEGHVLLDPNVMSSDGTIALTETEISPDGRLCAYAVSESGSDWMTWRVRDIDSGRDLPDVLRWSKFSGAAWTPAADELLYALYDEPSEGLELLAESRTGRLVRHRLGSPQSDDAVFWADPGQPEWIAAVSTTDDGRWAVVDVDRGTYPENQLHVLDLTDPNAALRPLVPEHTCSARLVGNVGGTFYVLTDADAERKRIVAMHVETPQPDSWRTIVPEAEDTLVDARLFGGRLVAHYLHHARSLLRVYSLDGTDNGEIELPGMVSVTELTGRFDSALMHIAVTSFADSGSIWSHELASGTTRCVSASTASFDADAVVVDQVFVSSADGTDVPVFLVHRRDVTPTGAVPVLLYGYGGFNVPLTPEFSVVQAVWVERGGLYAAANLRGGGEYGRAWHDAGRRERKQNVFDDFTAVARWLGTESGWSGPERVAIHGRSNGGLLVGACLTQHPELLGAAAPAVGVLDMLRFHRFTIGWAWTSDYGDPDDAEEFRWVRAYSPLHNIRPGTAYPPTLVLTGDHDDRVPPGHSFKFAAALQAAQTGAGPILLRVETSAGHGAGRPTQKLIEEAADLLAFLDLTVGRRALATTSV